MVHFVVGVRLGEVLDVDGPGVMVSQSWIDFNTGAVEVVLDGLSDVDGIVCDFLVGVAPDVVCRIVADPSDELGLQRILVIPDELEHAVQHSVWNITVVVTPIA